MKHSVHQFSRNEVARIRRECRERFEFASDTELLSFNVDPKTQKSNDKSDDFLTAIMYLAPYNLGGKQVCQWASVGCAAACLHTAGNPVYMEGKERARLARKRLYFEDRKLFKARLLVDIEKYRQVAVEQEKRLAVRLNGTADIVWEKIFPELFEVAPHVQFYDYTKAVKRIKPTWTLPANYDLTFSRSETNHRSCLSLLRSNAAARVSIVFSTSRFRDLPTDFEGYPVSDGDIHDMTFLRPPGWLGLRAKGLGRKDETGFVVSV